VQATRRPAQPLRLTRRGRLVVTLVLTMLVLGAFLLAGGASVATRDAGEPQPIRTVEVQSGQTLWGIASEIAEPGEVREMVYEIQRLNSLPDATLTEGQVLAVPAD
jgi:Tfp pilus assembly protein FimV